ncbi:ketopantoate reductase family protein [Salirhabdus salicampi]|uniref:ketopantoate reductase family protein n=1 Tax=Salirhabdus salicampi TaxID=476102 RepID=UPI0020C4C128|nr:2-dehydropantoate 2-reductase [Salirhabdus salicampi]MCP8616615.1 2-dehydropantoate 2-reductase [Salirhabdus salicampi]
MRIGVIGGGAIGLLLASYLRRQQHDITCYVKREEQAMELNQHGVTLLPNGITYKVYGSSHTTFQSEDLYIVCLKQYHLTNFIDNLKMIPSNIPILFLQNGMGHIPLFGKFKNPIFVGVVEHGAIRHSDNTVEHTGAGKIRVGVYNEKHQPILMRWIDILHRSSFPFVYEQNWERTLKEKLIVNAVINPLTALFQVRNGEVVSDDYIKTLAERICLECSTALHLPHGRMWERIKEISVLTAKNESSMLKDITLGRLTEIDAILGYIINQSQTYMPNTSFAYYAVKTIEKRRNSI